jgi:hypothetical protein
LKGAALKSKIGWNMNDAKLLALIKKLHQDAEDLYEDYSAKIKTSIQEISNRKKGLDLTLSKDDKNSVAAMQEAMNKVNDVRNKYTRSRERHKYDGLEEIFKIVNDWYDFMNIVTTIHFKSAQLITNGDQNDRAFSQEEKDQLIKVEEIIKRFTQRLK